MPPRASTPPPAGTSADSSAAPAPTAASLPLGTISVASGASQGATEAIDSEWPSADAVDSEWAAADEPATQAAPSVPPLTEALATAWGAEPAPEPASLAQLTRPEFPRDPAVPAGMKLETQALSGRRPELGPAKRQGAGEAPSGDGTAAHVVATAAHPATERAARAPRRPVASEELEPYPAKAKTRGRTLIVAAAALALAAVWLLTQRDAPPMSQAPAQSPTPRSQLEPAAPNAPGPRVVEPAPAAEPRAALDEPSSAAAQAAPQQSAPTPTADTPAAAAPAPSAAPSASDDAASASNATGKVTVVVKVRPPEARLYHRGKEVGMSPVSIELAPGEKRAFEVGKRGYITRRLVLDGTQTNVFIGLRPDPAASP